MGELRNRSCVVVVDGVRIEKLRMSFKVTKTLTKDPNKALIKIFNLASATRSAMKKKGAAVVLSAGYESNAAVIFSGDSRLTDHVKEGTDWVTTIECGDGERAYQFQRVSESFKPGTPIADVIRHCAKSLGINVGNLEEELARGDFRGGLTQFAHGYAVHGKASAELDKLMRTAGLSWSVQNGALQVLRGGAPATGSAILLTPETGLVGSPDFGTWDKKKNAAPIRVKSLLQPTIRCGGRVEIRASNIKGQFRVDKISHEGDTRGGNWYTDAEVKLV